MHSTQAVLTVTLQDRSFTFILKTPPASVLLQKAAGVAKGSGTPNSAKVGQVSRAQLKVHTLNHKIGKMPCLVLGCRLSGVTPLQCLAD